MNNYENNLDKNNANYVPLTPITFIERTKDIYPNYEAIIYGNRSYTWREVYERSIKFASALEKTALNLVIPYLLWLLIHLNYLKLTIPFQ